MSTFAQVTGLGGVGRTLKCTQCGWAGGAPLTFTFAWLRDCVAISGATATRFVLATADATHHVACRLTAQNPFGTAEVTRAAVIAPASGDLHGPSGQSPPKATITGVHESHSRWLEAPAVAVITRQQSRRKSPVATVISFTLNTAAAIALDFTPMSPGRSVGGHCVAPSRNARRYARGGTPVPLSFANGQAGANQISFDGEIARNSKLPPRPYALGLTATNAGGTGLATAPPFTILRPSRHRRS
jgi:hypothetical protein